MKYTNEDRLAFARSHKQQPLETLIHNSADIHPTAVIGCNGFGYVRDGDYALIEMPHAGRVVINEDVTVRAYVTIDRGTVGDTVIDKGTRIDHHSHIAHNAQIGKHNTLANGCIIEGSCIVGDYNQFGAGVIVQTKVKIGSYCILGSGSVITKDVEDYSVIVGNPGRLLRKNE